MTYVVDKRDSRKDVSGSYFYLHTPQLSLHGIHHTVKAVLSRMFQCCFSNALKLKSWSSPNNTHFGNLLEILTSSIQVKASLLAVSLKESGAFH